MPQHPSPPPTFSGPQSRGPASGRPAAAPPAGSENGGSLQAMENPISATFDLAESVNERVPRIKQLTKYASLFIGFSLLIDFILILLFLRENFFLFWVFLAFFVIGLFSIYWMHEVGDFFDQFSARHIAIKMMRDGDPVVHVPRGKDSLDQLLNHLKHTSPAMENLLRSSPRALQAPAIMKGASGVDYSFDAYISVPPAWPRGALGMGNPGYALFVKVLPGIPDMKDVRAVENAISDVVKVSGIPPRRAIILVENREGKEPLLPPDVYDHVTASRFVIPSGGKGFVCNTQIITIDSDGTYDFVPMVSTPPDALP